MTRKDYILIARELRRTLSDAESWYENGKRPNGCETIKWAAEGIANGLADDNPRFNRDHFLAVVRGEKALKSRPPRS